MAEINPRFCPVCLTERADATPFCRAGHPLCNQCRAMGEEANALNNCPVCRQPPRQCMICGTDGPTRPWCQTGHSTCTKCATKMAIRDMLTCPSCLAPALDTVRLTTQLTPTSPHLLISERNQRELPLHKLDHAIKTWPVARKHQPYIAAVRQTIKNVLPGNIRWTPDMCLNFVHQLGDEAAIVPAQPIITAMGNLMYRINQDTQDRLVKFV